jgi:hypothetical protein
MRTRDEHIEWSKQVALRHLPGNPRKAFAVMLSNLKYHPETENHAGCEIGVGMMLLPGWIDNPNEVRHWIEGFR